MAKETAESLGSASLELSIQWSYGGRTSTCSINAVTVRCQDESVRVGSHNNTNCDSKLEYEALKNMSNQ